MKTIKGEAELPTPEGDRASSQGFLRLKSDPTILQDCGSGELFKREDGKNWKNPAYQRDRKFKLEDGVRIPLPWSPLESTTAYCDDRIYPYAEKVAA